MKKAYPGHAKRVMMGVWTYLRQFMYTKWVIVVDDDINARDWKDVMWAISTRMDPARDITVIEDTPIDYLDFACPKAAWAARSAWTPPTSGRRKPSANGARRSDGRGCRTGSDPQVGQLRDTAQRQADMEVEKPMAERVIGWFRGLARDGVLVIIGDPGRAYVPKTGLEALAKFAVPTSLDLEDREVRDTVVWRLLAD